MLGNEDEVGQGVPDTAVPSAVLDESAVNVPAVEASDGIGGPEIDEPLSVADGVAAIRESVGIPARTGPEDSLIVTASETEPEPESAERVLVNEPDAGTDVVSISEPMDELMAASVRVHDDAEQRTRQGWPNPYGYDPALWP